jgi:hypothetical protein
MNCLFCSECLDERTKSQHIIPESVGGSLSTKSVTCSACNKAFGDGIDKVFAEKYQWLLVQLPQALYQGFVPPRLPAKTADGNEIWVLPGGRPEDRRFVMSFDKDSKTLRVQAPNETLLRKVMAKHKGEGRTWKEWGDSGQCQFGPQVFLGPEHYREATKILLEMLDHLGISIECRDAVRGAIGEELIDYVRHGREWEGCSSDHLVLSAAGRQWVNKAFVQLEAPDTPFHHRIWIQADSASGLVAGVVGILDTDYFGAVLSRRWKGESFEYFYQRSPIAGTQPDWSKFLKPPLLGRIAEMGVFRVSASDALRDLVHGFQRGLLNFSEYRELNADDFLAEEFVYQLTRHGDDELDQGHIGERLCAHLESIFSSKADSWKTEWPSIKKELVSKLPPVRLPDRRGETRPTRGEIIKETFIPIYKSYYKVCRTYIGVPFNFGVIQ